MSQVAKIMPARNQAVPIADVDEMSALPTVIKLNGKQCLLKPILVGELPETQRLITQAQENIVSAGTDFQKMVDAFHLFISRISDDITLDDIKSLSIMKLNRLMKLIQDHIYAEMAGISFDDYQVEKKKILMHLENTQASK